MNVECKKCNGVGYNENETEYCDICQGYGYIEECEHFFEKGFCKKCDKNVLETLKDDHFFNA